MCRGARHQSVRLHYIRSAGEIARANRKSLRLTAKHRAPTSVAPFLEIDITVSPGGPKGFKLPPRTTRHCFRPQKVTPSGSTMSLPPTVASGARAFCLRSFAAYVLPRCGNCSEASASPKPSLRISMRSAKRPTSPRTTRTPASTPIPTPESPFSSRAIVLGEVPARAARSATVMPRRRRAPRTSPPSLLRAVLAFGELTQSSIYE